MGGIFLEQSPIYFNIPDIWVKSWNGSYNNPSHKQFFTSRFVNIWNDESYQRKSVFKGVEKLQLAKVRTFIIALLDTLHNSVRISDCSDNQYNLESFRRVACAWPRSDWSFIRIVQIVADCVGKVTKRCNQWYKLVSHPNYRESNSE